MAKWNCAKIVAFLDIYQSYPMLYDKKNPDYSNRDSREKAIQQIIQRLADHGIVINAEELRKKTKSIRQTFANELNKVKKSEEESSNGEIYTPKLIWYQAAMFFAEHMNLRKMEDSQLQLSNRSESETDISFITTERLNGEYVYDQTENLQDSETEFLVPNTPQSNISSTESTSAKRKCLEYIDNMQTMIEKLDKMEKLRNKEDSIDLFCKLLNKDMRELTPKNQLLFRQKVSNFMMKLKLEQLGSHDNIEVVEFDLKAEECN